MDRVEVTIVDGPLGEAGGSALDGVGAVLRFEGVVRPEEDGSRLEALEYEAYEPMTTRQLTELGEAMVESHALTALRVEHSVGRVRPGEVSFRLTVWSAHRQEALAAVDVFIDWMKAEIALWKVPVWPATAEAGR